ncbi:hypothetical protein Tco_0536442 [Tanacetum coccineum]
MPKRKWTVVDQKRLGLMIELTDKQLRERKIIRNLERLVGARELEMDYKLMMLVIDPVTQCTTLPSHSRKAFTSALTQYVEYLAEFWYTAKALESSKIWVSTPRGGVREIGYNGEIRVKGTLKKSCLPPSVDFAKIIWEDLINKLNKKSKERVIPYPRFISLLLEYMAPEYANESLTINPTQVFSSNNWALKPNQPEEPLFTEHMLAVCKTVVPNVPKAPKPSFDAERIPQGINLELNLDTRSIQLIQHNPLSNSEASKGGSSKRPTGSKTGHLKRKKESISAMESNQSQPSASNPVIAEMHKEDQQATGDLNSLGVTSKEGDHPQLSSGMSAFTNIEPVFLASYILHSESTSGNDALADFTAEADPENSATNDSIPHQ